LLGHPATAGISFIVETPEPAAAKARDVATLKALRARTARQSSPDGHRKRTVS
jgi:hypothetical protein